MESTIFGCRLDTYHHNISEIIVKYSHEGREDILVNMCIQGMDSNTNFIWIELKDSGINPVLVYTDNSILLLQTDIRGNKIHDNLLYSLDMKHFQSESICHVIPISIPGRLTSASSIQKITYFIDHQIQYGKF
jgi:hypothetical protein